ncbi:hypothetical protein Hanom_Chr09g00806561 [Helianthus anomalus]
MDCPLLNSFPPLSSRHRCSSQTNPNTSSSTPFSPPSRHLPPAALSHRRHSPHRPHLPPSTLPLPFSIAAT